MTNHVYASLHASKQVRQKCGLKKSAITGNIERAYNLGIDATKTTGFLKEWCEDKIRSSRYTYKLYSGKLYIFYETMLITVINVPGRYTKQLANLRNLRMQ